MKTLKERLIDISDTFDRAKRVGHGEQDDPEGTLVIIVSDTLAKELSTELRNMASEL